MCTGHNSFHEAELKLNRNIFMYYVEQDFITYLSIFCPDSNTKNGNAIHVVNETDRR